MVNRTIYNLKTLQIKPTNGLHLKGLLTYRTIQFSMSSGCYHPKNFPPVLSPNSATKNPRADLIILNSASQSFVNSRPDYQGRAGCQRVCFSFFRCCMLATSINLPTPGRLSKTFLTYFPPPKLLIPKECGGENILRQNSCKRFFNFFFANL